MEKPTIYVLQKITMDYYEFSELLLASTDLNYIKKLLDLAGVMDDVYNWWELSDKEKMSLYTNEICHYRITKF